MKASEIACYVESLSPEPGPEEGFCYGDRQQQVTGVLVAWMGTVEAIEEAVQQGCNMMIVHEDLFFPYDLRHTGPRKHLTWRPNRRRLEALAAHSLVVYRAHGMLDRFCILDDFAELLGLGEPTVSEGYVRIYELAHAVTVEKMVERVKERTGLDQARVTGDPKVRVKRVGLPWGGLGLSINVAFIESLLEHNPDLLIAGETDDYAMRFVLDAGVSMIETTHSVSEDPGLHTFAAQLKADFPGLQVVYFDVGVPWQYL